MSRNSLSRRAFLKSTVLTTTGVLLGERLFAVTKGKSPNEKLNIAIIGTANRALENIHGVSDENIVALCDVDDIFLRTAGRMFPQAKTYSDFRLMLEQKDIDAVVVSTADHTHAVATMAALKSGRHVYCEKPLTHTVAEARAIAKAAAKYKLATQMGTQIHAGGNYRRVVELIQSGAIGSVDEVHVWVEKGWFGGERPSDQPPIPSNLHWDLWLGPAPARPYNPTYLPRNWRRWWDFGNGTLGDMACHFMDLPHWALKLRHPVTIEAEGPPVHPETTPATLTVHYEYPKRDGMPPVKLTWYDGGLRPALINDGKVPNWRNGVLFVGAKGMLLADYDNLKLLPEDQFKDFTPPPRTIAESIGHHKEWIQACKTGSPTTCNFDYSGALTEAVLLGNVAYRSGKKLEWNAEKLKVTNSKEAMAFISREYRKGWKL